MRDRKGIRRLFEYDFGYREILPEYSGHPLRLVEFRDTPYAFGQARKRKRKKKMEEQAKGTEISIP